MVYISVGYEGGTIFEDENAVLLSKGESTNEMIPNIHIQSQQQQ